LSAADIVTATIPMLPRIATPVRQVNDRLWALLSKPGPLSAEEWAYVEECERNG